MESFKWLTIGDQMVDCAVPEEVEVIINQDSGKIWVNVDGICRFRAYKVKHLTVEDRSSTEVLDEDLNGRE